MSTGRTKTVLLSVFAVGMLGFTGFYACERTDGIRADRADPELVTEGTHEGAQWAVLRFRGDGDDCLELRHRGATVGRSCFAANMLGQYEVKVYTLTGTRTPMVFGILPAGTVRAEVALDGETTLRRDPRRPTAPVTVLDHGDAGLFVAEPAPAGRTGTVTGEAWRDSVTVEAFDIRDNRLTPKP